MKKRILFTVINDLVYDQRMMRICGYLSEQGYDCELIGRKLPASPELKMKTYRQHRMNCLFHKGKLFYVEYNCRLFFYLLFQKCDAICSIDPDTVLPGLLVSRLRSKKHIFDAHELFTEVPEVKDRGIVKRIWGWAQRLAFTRTDSAYTVGEAIAEHFEKLYGRQVEVVRNVPALTAQIPYAPDPEKFILYQGALNQGRGLENLIRAMEYIPSKLVLAGEGDLSRDLRSLAENTGVQGKVTFSGFVEPEALKILTSKAWIGMNVSENMGLSYYLSLNNKFFDYIHAGLPSLINDFPEYRKLNLQFQVGVLTDSDVQDIVKNALLLLNDEKLHSDLSRNCIKASAELNWEHEREQLNRIYTSVFEK